LRRALLAGVFCAQAAGVSAQAAGGSYTKAAFLLNFATFTEWPGLADGAIAICVESDDDVAAALQSLGAKGTLDGRRVQVRVITPDQRPRGCHMLYLGARLPQETSGLIDSADGSLLTVSDTARFAEGGGMIELFEDKGRIRFAVNVDAVRRSRLRVSSRVLGLARIVRDANVR
jgi:hypothetical protein